MINGIHCLRPIQLAMKDVGVFATEEPVVITFSGPPADAAAAPFDRGIDEVAQGMEFRRSARPPDSEERGRPLPNFSLLRDSTGDGMSIALDCIFALFDLLSATGNQKGRAASRIGLVPTSEVQLDLRLACRSEYGPIEAILSIWIGAHTPTVHWADLLAREGAFGAHVWASIGFDPITLAQNEGTNDLGRALLEGVRDEERRAGSVDLRAGVDEFLPAGAAVAMPSVLLFGRGTMSRSERYAPARGFGLEPVENHSMLCERLSAMRPADREPFLKELSKAVLDDGRPSPARLVFDDEDGGLAISFAERQHSLALLDRSERALLTLHAAIMLHGTSTTIVLIDGIDCHCLPEDLGYLNNSLAEILVRDRGSTVIFASATQPAVDSFVSNCFPDHVTIGGCLASGVR